jgi:hypothetical protein
VCERGEELIGPGPLRGKPQGRPSAAVHDPAWKRDESGADSARDGELVVGVHVSEVDGPADQVVSESCAREPRRVRGELAGRAVFEAGSFLMSRIASSTTACCRWN